LYKCTRYGPLYWLNSNIIKREKKHDVCKQSRDYSAFIEEILNQKKLAIADEIVAEDFIELDPFPGQAQGRQGLKDVLGMFFSGFPDMHWVVEEQIAEGDKVVTRFTWTGSQQGAFMGIPTTGKQVKVKGVVIDRVIAGRLVDSRILMDSMGMMQQLGVVPSGQ
jgi:steroid delta-isomerase-like uncharacterized protein